MFSCFLFLPFPFEQKAISNKKASILSSILLKTIEIHLQCWIYSVIAFRSYLVCCYSGIKVFLVGTRNTEDLHFVPHSGQGHIINWCKLNKLFFFFLSSFFNQIVSNFGNLIQGSIRRLKVSRFNILCFKLIPGTVSGKTFLIKLRFLSSIQPTWNLNFKCKMKKLCDHKMLSLNFSHLI